jgi:glyoxylase-like metal-dependent hydrolase (beta-lactamase superfamily II)
MEKRDFHSSTIITLVVGQLATNCYLLIDRKTQELMIIDPGDDADYIERVVSDFNAKPQMIVATHGHFDHILAGFELQTAYSIPFYIHKKDEFLVKDLQARANHWLRVASPPPPKIDGYLKEKDTIRIGFMALTVLETPGHTPGGISLSWRGENITFVGDLIFANGGVGRTDFSYSSIKDLDKSLKKVLSLSSDTEVFSGHGENFILESYTFTG